MFTPELLILRKPYAKKPVWSEQVFLVLLFVYLVFLVLSLPIFNVALRDYIFDELKLTNTSRNYAMVSVFPFVASIVVCTLFPQIIFLWDFLGYTVYNFNGYIIPLILKVSHERKRKRPVWKYSIGIGVFVIAMLVSLGFLLYRSLFK